MALYRYKAFSKEGKKLSGFIDAPSVAHVKQQLSVQGMYPVSIAPAAQEARQAWWKHLVVRGVTSKEKFYLPSSLLFF